MHPIIRENGPQAIIEHEAQLQRAVMAYIITGIAFMLLPGTFLGVWNLISISNRHQLDSLSPTRHDEKPLLSLPTPAFGQLVVAFHHQS